MHGGRRHLGTLLSSDLESMGPEGCARPEPVPFRSPQLPPRPCPRWRGRGILCPHRPSLPPSLAPAASPGSFLKTDPLIGYVSVHPGVSKERPFSGNAGWLIVQAAETFMGMSDQDRARGGMRREGQAREPALHSHHALAWNSGSPRGLQ